MAKDLHRIRRVYEKTDGHCHICRRRLDFKKYGHPQDQGGWHIEHSIPRVRGGTNHLNNLFPACVGCNINKGVQSSRVARAPYGHSRAPYSGAKKRQIEEINISAGIAIGALLGLTLGPAGAVFGALIGGVLGSSNSPTI